MCCVPGLVIQKLKIHVALIAVITWCTCSKEVQVYPSLSLIQFMLLGVAYRVIGSGYLLLLTNRDHIKNNHLQVENDQIMQNYDSSNYIDQVIQPGFRD